MKNGDSLSPLSLSLSLSDVHRHDAHCDGSLSYRDVVPTASASAQTAWSIRATFSHWDCTASGKIQTTLRVGGSIRYAHTGIMKRTTTRRSRRTTVNCYIPEFIELELAGRGLPGNYRMDCAFSVGRAENTPNDNDPNTFDDSTAHAWLMPVQQCIVRITVGHRIYAHSVVQQRYTCSGMDRLETGSRSLTLACLAQVREQLEMADDLGSEKTCSTPGISIRSASTVPHRQRYSGSHTATFPAVQCPGSGCDEEATRWRCGRRGKIVTLESRSFFSTPLD